MGLVGWVGAKCKWGLRTCLDETCTNCKPLTYNMHKHLFCKSYLPNKCIQESSHWTRLSEYLVHSSYICSRPQMQCPTKQNFSSCKRVTETDCKKAACVRLNWKKKRKESGSGDRCIQEVYQPFNKGNPCIPFLKLNFISRNISHTAKDQNFRYQPFDEGKSGHSISQTELISRHTAKKFSLSAIQRGAIVHSISWIEFHLVSHS